MSCAATVVMHVHLTDQTLRDNHGVVRTDTGPILLEQLKRYLIQHEATITVHPVIDPAATASADSYEIRSGSAGPCRFAIRGQGTLTLGHTTWAHHLWDTTA